MDFLPIPLHGWAYTGHGFESGLFHGPNIFWIGLLLFLAFRLSGGGAGCGHRRATRPVTRTPDRRPADPAAATEQAQRGPVWPDLYPDSTPRPPKDEPGKVEYF